MDELTAFLRAIADEPDDDAHRLVFADWLDDHGHESRAEFIRLQVELAHLDPGDDTYPAKVARMRRTGVYNTPGAIPYFDHVPDGECRVAFGRGMIEVLHAWRKGSLDGAGLELVPLRSLRTSAEAVEAFRGFAKLRQLELHARDATPERLLEILGPGGWFLELEELVLTGDIKRECLEAGVIPRFDLPRLRRFCLSSAAFYDFGSSAEDWPEEDDEYGERRPWGGLPGYLPGNAIPGPASPLERFVWHSSDDCDYFNDEDWYWRGPAMESLLDHLKGRGLKQVEIAVSYDDHESGSEGVIAAPYLRNPLDVGPTLSCVTLDAGDLGRLEGQAGKVASLRVYGDDGFGGPLLAMLARPVCSDLRSLYVEARGWWSERGAGPGVTLASLRSLHLGGVPLAYLSECPFPELLSLSGSPHLGSVLGRAWPKLQRLTVRIGNPPDLQALARSDRLPNLTSLTIECNFDPATADLSCFADCPHMPHLSYLRVPNYSRNLEYIVERGRLTPVRADIMVEEPTPLTQYRLSAVF